MKIETLQERINKANEKIEKKQNTIAKYYKTIDKKMNTLVKKYNWNPEDREQHVATLQNRGFTREQASEISWTLSDIENAEEGIENNQKQIEETKKTIAKYEAQLAGEIERESIIAKEIPESMKGMQRELEDRWNEFDMERKKALYEEYKEIGYREFMKTHPYSDYKHMKMSEDEIKKSNEKDARMFVLNLYNRVKEITGVVTDWDGIRLEVGGMGIPTLTGFVKGTEGNAYVETILAGGYNIQRLHIRTLVHSR